MMSAVSSSDTDLALKAWNKANRTLKRLGQKTENVILHQDRDCVYTGHGWLHEIVVKSKTRISYSEDGARKNVYMESFNGRFKEENRVLFWEQDDLESFKKFVDVRFHYYNYKSKHSALGNKPPREYLKEKGNLSF